MDLKQIKELMVAMEKAGMTKLTLKEKTGFELHLEKQEAPVVHSSHPSFSHSPVFLPGPSRMHEPSHFAPVPHKEDSEKKDAGHRSEGKYITSPMVGAFYVAASPEDSPFVKPGDRVEESTVVCIIEAMKVMNEVKAGVAGVIAEVCLENGHPVEFGTKLFRIV